MEKSLEASPRKTPLRKDDLISEINESIIRICQSELMKFFEELKEDIILKIESDLSVAIRKLKEVCYYLC